MTEQLAATIDSAWEARDSISVATRGEVREAVEAALGLLDSGEARVAQKVDGAWQVNQWLKKAVLLSFRLNAMAAIPGGPGGAPWWDKVDSKFLGWDAERFEHPADPRAARNMDVAANLRAASDRRPGVDHRAFADIGAEVDEARHQHRARRDVRAPADD